VFISSERFKRLYAFYLWFAFIDSVATSTPGRTHVLARGRALVEAPKACPGSLRSLVVFSACLHQQAESVPLQNPLDKASPTGR